MARLTLDPNKPPELSPEDRARYDALTDDEIDHIAEADEENPPLGDEQLDRMVAARDVREAREATGLGQHAFATALAIPIATMRNWEQARVMPEPAARTLLRLVAADPGLILGMLNASRETAGDEAPVAGAGRRRSA